MYALDVLDFHRQSKTSMLAHFAYDSCAGCIYGVTVLRDVVNTLVRQVLVGEGIVYDIKSLLDCVTILERM